MLRKLRYQARFNRQRLISLVLIPAFSAGTLPHTACICADGHREEHCRAIQPLVVPHGTSAAKCNCCSSRSTAGAAGNVSCHGRGLQVASPSALTIGKSCCQPIIEGPASAIPVSKTDVHLGAKCVGLAFTQDSTLPGASISFSRPAAHPGGPPPLDAIIVYLHLTI
jgi:hypothetical protein